MNSYLSIEGPLASFAQALPMSCAAASDNPGANVPHKRRRVSTNRPTPRRPSGRAGKLRHLPEMPLDILFEIFGHLDPFDILHLARTTKALRGILMSKTARFIWKQARSNMDGFPDCPSDLSEPQYANLAFDPHCHYCLYPHTPRILWACRVRCCKNCLPEEFVPASRLQNNLELPLYPVFYLPYIYHQPLRRRGELYSLRHARTLAQEYVEALFEPESLRNWEDAKRQALQDRNAHATLCERWHRKWTASRSQELDAIRRGRKEAILVKLRDIGWGTEIEKLMAYEPRILLDHALVKQPKPLTQRIWQNIKPKLIAFLETIRSKRIQRDRLRAINDRCGIMATILDAYILTQDPAQAFPSVADVCDLKEVKSIIQNTPMEIVLSKDDFAEVGAELPRLCDEWRSSKNRELVAMMKAAGVAVAAGVHEGQESDVDVSCLKLATTWFSCRDCQEPIGYPRVLAHGHAIALDYRDRSGDETPEMFQSLNCDLWNRNGNRIGFHRQAYETARKIVAACDLDPDVTTADAMNEMDPILACSACYDATDGPSGGKLVMRWRRAIHHATTHSEGPCWETLSRQERLYVENIEKTVLYFPGLPDLACVHCRLRTSLRYIKDHVRTQHKRDPTDVDYFFHIDASIQTIPSSVRIPELATKSITGIPSSDTHALIGIPSSDIQALIASSNSALRCRITSR